MRVALLSVVLPIILLGCATDCGKSTAGWSAACGVKHAMGSNTQTQAYLDAQRQRAEEREAQVAAAQTRSQELQAQLRRAQTELAAVERSTSPLRQKAAALRQEMGKKTAEIELIQQDIQSLQSQIQALEAKKDKADADWARRQALLDELARQQQTINELDRYIEQQLLDRAAEILRNA